MALDDLISAVIADLEAIRAQRDRIYQRQREVEEALAERTQDLVRRTQQLLTQKQLTDLILNSAGEGIYGTDEQDRAVFLNPAGEKMVGYSAAELIGRCAHDVVHHIHPDGTPFPVEECDLHRTLQDGLPRSGESELVRRDGTFLPIEYVATAIERGGKIVGGVFVFRDISQRRELTQTLVEQHRKLSELEALRSKLCATVVHDLRAPLMTVRGYVELLEDTDKLSPALKDYLQQIELAVARQERLLDDLMVFSRAESGCLALHLQSCDLGELLHEVAKAFQPQMQAANVELDLKVDPGLPAIPLDEGRIEQVVTNLISNALKFTPAGQRIAVSVGMHGEEIRVEVADPGPGIATDELPHLFQPFGQLAEGERRGGFGLGLYIAKTLVEAHGGAIGVESEPGHGARFWFHLPLAVPVTR